MCINIVSSSAVLWEPGTSLSTSLEVERPPDVSLPRAYQHNVIDVSSYTPVSVLFSLWWIWKSQRLLQPLHLFTKHLKRARRLGHLSCMALRFKLMPKYWKWRPKTSLLIFFYFFKGAFSRLHSIILYLPWTALNMEIKCFKRRGVSSEGMNII